MAQFHKRDGYSVWEKTLEKHFAFVCLIIRLGKQTDYIRPEEVSALISVSRWTKQMNRLNGKPVCLPVLGSLRKHDGNVKKNVALKWLSQSFKLFAFIPTRSIF